MQPTYTCLRCLRTQAGRTSRSYSSLSISPRIIRATAGSKVSEQRHRNSQLASPFLASQITASYHTSSPRPRTAAEALSAVADDGSLNGIESERSLLQPNNLFHPLSKSPSADMRRRAAFMRRHAYCSHPSHMPTRVAESPSDPESRKDKSGRGVAPAHVNFECPRLRYTDFVLGRALDGRLRAPLEDMRHTAADQ